MLSPPQPRRGAERCSAALHKPKPSRGSHSAATHGILPWVPDGSQSAFPALTQAAYPFPSEQLAVTTLPVAVPRAALFLGHREGSGGEEQRDFPSLLFLFFCHRFQESASLCLAEIYRCSFFAIVVFIWWIINLKALPPNVCICVSHIKEPTFTLGFSAVALEQIW